MIELLKKIAKWNMNVGRTKVLQHIHEAYLRQLDVGSGCHGEQLGYVGGIINGLV